MTRTRFYACAIVVAASLAGCRSTGEVEYAGEVRVASPELIALGPGVQVVADADEPLFFADGVYWLYRDGYWFRANDYRGDFVRVELSLVPQQLQVIERPETYAHYRSTRGRTREARQSPTRTRSQQQTPPAQGEDPMHQQHQDPMHQQHQDPMHQQHQDPMHQQHQDPMQQQQDPTQQQQPSQTPAPQPSAPTPPAQLPSQTPTTPTDPHAPHQRRTPGANPAQPTSPPGNNAPVQPGETSAPVDEPDRATPPSATNTDDRTDTGNESKKVDEKKDPNTTDE